MHNEIKEDIAEIKKSIVNIEKCVAVQTTDWQHHMKRTELNEQRISKIETWALGLVTTLVVGTISYILFKK